ncbi:hypothetical protein [Legionella oakridgensis]|uniref:Uncharacterized protein n=2 Tax=Legionella oakridgensis TaxID=29423 RepID=W0B721_9GAMM|nr:hypothetical protein [Legionella oakridgensis]AHE65665.1 hypothetical protein Loa_00074 [Legionella oakridgensis ATCC 33761 = DSM 21215]KTD38253.1 hypothetical protein Loak_1929 [Legionella oakridgensis]STY15615.1 Uncharacterised protein [Legionella longbeachae]
MPGRSEREIALDVIKDIRRKLEPVGGDNPNQFQQVKNKVMDESRQYLAELEDKLNKASAENDEKAISQTLRSLRVLNLNTSGFSLLFSGLKLMHNISDKIFGHQRADPQLLEQLGKDVLDTAKNFNALLDDSSKSLGSKVWNVMKAFVLAAIDGIVGMFKGMKKGFEEGKGIETLSSTLQGAVTGGFAGFFKKFSEELGKASSQEAPSPSQEAPSHSEGAFFLSRMSDAATPAVTLSENDMDGVVPSQDPHGRHDSFSSGEDPSEEAPSPT